MGKAIFRMVYTMDDGSIECMEFSVNPDRYVDAYNAFSNFKKNTERSFSKNLGDSTTDDIARIFKVTPTTIKNLVAKGMPFAERTVKGYRFRKDEVFEWVRVNRKNYIYRLKQYLKEDSNEAV